MARNFVVEAYRATADCDLNVRHDAWSLALDQRAFGPRRLLVAFADETGRVLSLAHTRRPRQAEHGLAPCIETVGLGAPAAVAFCDEPVHDGPIPEDQIERWARAQRIVASYGIELVDWFCCDDTLLRSTRLAIDPHSSPWDAW